MLLEPGNSSKKSLLFRKRLTVALGKDQTEKHVKRASPWRAFLKRKDPLLACRLLARRTAAVNQCYVWAGIGELCATA